MIKMDYNLLVMSGRKEIHLDKTPWRDEGVILPPTPKAEKLGEIFYELKNSRPARISEADYGHAIRAVQILAETEIVYRNKPTEKRKIQSRLRKKLRGKVEEGILPQEVLNKIDDVLGREGTSDPLGWEEEPKEWRE